MLEGLKCSGRLGLALAASLLGWHSTHDVDAMCADGWRWQQGNPQGYEQDAPP